MAGDPPAILARKARKAIPARKAPWGPPARSAPRDHPERKASKVIPASLGAMYAAQWFATIRRESPDLDARVARGDASPAFDWIRANVWSQARRWETDEFARRASGETLNPTHFRKHLESRYLG